MKLTYRTPTTLHIEFGQDYAWRWSSLFQFKQNEAAAFNFLTQWPMERPQNWIEFVNAPDNASEETTFDRVHSEVVRLGMKIG